MNQRTFFGLATAAALTVAGTRGLDAYLAQGPQLEAASFSPEQREIIKFVASRFDIIGFGGNHNQSGFDYLFSDKATLADLNKSGAIFLFLEQNRADQTWLDAARLGSRPVATIQQDCMQRGLNGWFSRAQNAELCARTIDAAQSVGGINMIAASARSTSLSYSTTAQVTGAIASLIVKGLFPNSASGEYTQQPKYIVDYWVGGQVGNNNLDDRETTALIASRIKPGDVGVVAYGANHFSGAARINGGVDMVSGLRARGLKTVTININFSGLERGDFLQRNSDTPGFTAPDIDFFPQTKLERAAVIFNNPALGSEYTRARSAPTP